MSGDDAGNHQTVPVKRLFEGAIEFVAMTMPFGNHRGVVNAMSQEPGCKIRGISAQPHRSADRVDAKKIAQFVDDRMRSVLLELRAVGFCQPANVARIFDDGALHAETDSEIRHLLLARVLNGANHSGNAAFAEAAGNEDAVELGESRRTVDGLQALGFDPMNLRLQVVQQAAVDERFAQALVGIFQCDVLADDADRNFVDRIVDALASASPMAACCARSGADAACARSDRRDLQRSRRAELRKRC